MLVLHHLQRVLDEQLHESCRKVVGGQRGWTRPPWRPNETSEEHWRAILDHAVALSIAGIPKATVQPILKAAFPFHPVLW